MAGINDTGIRSFLPGSTDIPKYSRVVATSTGCDLAGANDETLGSAKIPGYAPDSTRGNFQDEMSIKMWNAPGDHFAIASAAIAAGAEFQGAASGKIAPLAGGKPIGRLLETAATADNDVIPVLFYPPSGDVVLADPGDAGDIEPVAKDSYVELVTAGAETRTLSDPDFAGQKLVLTMYTDGGNAVVTADSAVNVAGNTTLTFADVQDTISLVGVRDGASAYRWSVVGNDGVALS